jgi:hypothetical protein
VWCTVAVVVVWTCRFEPAGLARLLRRHLSRAAKELHECTTALGASSAPCTHPAMMCLPSCAMHTRARVLDQLRDVGIELPVAWRPLRPCTHTVSHSVGLVLLLWRFTESARRRVARGDTLAAEREVKASRATLRGAEQRFETAGGHLHREVSDWHTHTLSLSLSLPPSLSLCLYSRLLTSVYN